MWNDYLFLQCYSKLISQNCDRLQTSFLYLLTNFLQRLRSATEKLQAEPAPGKTIQILENSYIRFSGHF